MEQGQTLFSLFGGVRPMARALHLPPQNVSAWKRVGRIPAEKQPFVLEVAAELGLPVTAQDVVYPNGDAPVRELLSPDDAHNCHSEKDGKPEQCTAPWNGQA